MQTQQLRPTSSRENRSLAPASGRTGVERRRRALTIMFGVFVGILIVTLESRWPFDTSSRTLLFFLGICLAAAGMQGRTWCHLFISGYKTRALIRCGPYSICRNPLYLFSAIGMTGVGLCSATIAIPVVMVVFFAAYYPWIIRCEERRLEERHFAEFSDYRRATPAFWPQPSRYSEPDRYEVFPRIIRTSILDGLWFVVLAAFVHVLADLHALKVLPALYAVW